jgi:hypothetical protein
VHDLACVVHLHSLHSDGTGTVREIVRAGRRAGVDVVMLTDHDTLAARRAGDEGWHDGVLLLVGEEVSPPRRDHCLAFGVAEEIDNGLGAEGIVRAIRAAGGLSFAAHPWSRGSRRFERAGTGMPFAALDSADLDGVELWSFVTDTAETLGSLPEALRFVVAPGRVLAHPPERNMRAWDLLCRSRRVVAIGGLDAHQIGKRIGPVVPLRLMAYSRSFRYLRTHVLCQEPPSGDLGHDREQVYGALREGRCYLAMDSLRPARGFTFGAPDLPMGAEAAAAERTLRAAVPTPAELRLLRDGEPVAVASRAVAIAADVDAPGVYRVEARLRAHGRDRTWIVSNPVYMR